AETGGAMVAPMLLKENVGIVDGLFSVSLDFGIDALNGEGRWLQVAVRSPAGAGAFTTLAIRQPLAAAPYAHHSLRPWTSGNNTGNTNSGNVGIGTAIPAKKLSVEGNMELGTSSGDYSHMRIGGGHSDGFLYGPFPSLGDGIHMGYNFFADASGANQIVHSDEGTSRISMGNGSIVLATGGINENPVNRLVLSPNGNVGIGTPFPAVKLEVRGDVRLGNSGERSVPGSNERLRIIRGNVDGTGAID